LNRQLAGQTLSVEFKNPWNFLAETVVEARSAETDSARFACVKTTLPDHTNVIQC